MNTMILSRAPMRITLGGGGTDLKSYYSKHGGFLIAAAIDRYASILVSKRFYDNIHLSYSRIEVRDSVDTIEHQIFRESLKLLEIGKGIEIHSVSNVPANAGLGSSSSFTVALLNALHTYKGDTPTKRQLAEEACHIEIDRLGEPIGKQDQYMAAFGGITCLTFEKNGDVLVEPLRISAETLEQLENNLLFFFTGKERRAAEVLSEQDEKSKNDDPAMVQNLHQIKDIGLKTREYLEKGKIDMLGELLHVHWEFKKKRSRKMTDPFIDECYEVARQKGALGGKLIGAGGGGFLMFYCNNGLKPKVTEALNQVGLRRDCFGIDYEGTKIILGAKSAMTGV